MSLGDGLPRGDDAEADPGPTLQLYRPRRMPNERRATVSLVLGLLSLVTCGLTAIPAVAIGLSARTAIERSRGQLRGEGLANAGIATGVAGTIISLVAALAFVAGIFFSTHDGTARHPGFLAAPDPSPGSTTSWSATPPRAPPASMSIGSIHVIDIDPTAGRTFHQQLAEESRRAATAHQTLILMTTARECSVCREIEAALPDARMQLALANVDLVRVDVRDFDDELHEAGMLEDTLPWFYKLDASLRPLDAINAGEWDDNIPANMAPVLRSFLAGTLRARRDPSAMGTSL